MKNRKLPSRIPLAMLGAVLCLSSCALPPREAWRVIQRDGLIPYLAIEAGKRPVPPYVRRTNASVAASQSAKQGSAPVTRAISQAATAPRAVPFVSAVPQTRFLTTPEAAASAPRPVVRVQEKPKAVAQSRPHPVHRAAPAPASPPLEFRRAAPARQSTSATVPAPPPIKTKTIPAPSKVVQAPKPKPDASAPPKKTDAPKSNIAKTADATPAPKEQPAPKPVAASGVDIPYGTAVPGRPGLVTSPYAGKLQLVDVTGLSPGQEVKCPYSGKLFRVPPSQQAASKPPQPAADAPPAKKNP